MTRRPTDHRKKHKQVGALRRRKQRKQLVAMCLSAARVLFKSSPMAEGGRGELFILERRFAPQQMQKSQCGAKMFLVTNLPSKPNTQVKHRSEAGKAALKNRSSCNSARRPSACQSSSWEQRRLPCQMCPSKVKPNFGPLSVHLSKNLVTKLHLQTAGLNLASQVRGL